MKKTAILFAAFIAFLGTPFLADGYDDDDDEEKYGLEALLEARRAGDVLPLIAILTRIHPITGDNVVDVEFEQEDGRYKYGIYYLDDKGRRREVYVDAQSGDVLKDEMDD